jgi:hypothetical protein
MAVDSISKPADTPCVHLCDKACSIYQFRPDDCRAFECVWLQTQATTAPWPKRLRPDKCGVMFVPTTDPNTMAAHGPRVRLEMPPLDSRVKSWLASGLRIISVDGMKRTLIHWTRRH